VKVLDLAPFVDRSDAKTAFDWMQRLLGEFNIVLE